MSTPKNEIKSSTYSVLKSDHRYDFLSLLQNMVYTFEPDTKKINENVTKFFSNTRKVSKENKVPIFQLNNSDDYDYVVNDILKFDHEHNLSENNKELFDSIYSKFSNVDYIKELYLDGIKDNFGMDNIQEGGLFWLEETEDGLDAVFAHIDDISNLEVEEQDNFLDNVITNKKQRSESYIEEHSGSPLLKFEGIQLSKNDIQKMNPDERSSLLALLIEENNRIYDLKENKLIIKFRHGRLHPFIPEIDDKIKKFYPKYKALYFFVLLNSKGLKYNDLKKSKYLEDLTKLYKSFNNYKKKNGDSSMQNANRTMSNMIQKSNSISYVRSKANSSLRNHIEGFYSDLNLAHHILKDVSFTNAENFLNIPIDRNEIENIYLIRKALNGKFDVADYRIK